MSKKAIAIIVVIILLVIIGVIVYFMNQNSNESETNTNSNNVGLAEQTEANNVNTLAEDNKGDNNTEAGNGKTVIPFCTSSSSGIGQSGDLLEEEANGGNWQEGHRFRSNPSDSDINNWTDSLK